MARRDWTAALAVVAAWSGSTAAQPQAPATEANVITLRTAGQPERRLQVLKTERLPDGKVLSEVKDLATGAVFTIADTKPLGSPEPAPTATVPASASLPQARPRNVDPLLAGTPATMAASSRPRSSYENVPTVPANPGEIPTLVGRFKKTPSALPVTEPQYAAAASTTKQSPVAAALFGSTTGQPAQPPAALFGRSTSVVKPLETRAVSAAPTMPATNNPTLMGKLFGEKPTAAVVQPMVAKVQPTVIRPNAVPNVAPLRTLALAPPPMEAPSVIQVQAAPAFTAVSTDSRDPNFHVVPVQAMTMKQIEILVKDLRMHHKPSQRVEAAVALASGPMSGMVEVRQILAEASYRDPEPIVRGHCIDLLTKMHYDEPNYRKYVETLVNSDEPALSRAARASMR